MNTKDGTRNFVWVDIAKAICACLVVVMHAEAQIAVVGWADSEKIMAMWHVINAFFQPIRMPTFFTISGLLASGSLSRPRADSFRKGFAQPLYLYLVWAMIFAVLTPRYPYFDNNATISIAERIEKVVLLGSPAWYLYALALYYLAAKVMTGLPTTPLLIACALLSAWGAVLVPDQEVYASKLCHCLFFFIAGVRLKDQLINFCEAATSRKCLLLLSIYVVVAALAKGVDMHLLPLDIAAVAFGLLAFSLLGQHLGPLTATVQWVGRHSLLVYVLQFPLMLLFSRLVQACAKPSLLEVSWLGLTYPIILTVLVLPSSLAVGVAMKRLGLAALFGLQQKSSSMTADKTIGIPTPFAVAEHSHTSAAHHHSSA
jgi:uncharacterized membrane protein YcfT